MSRIICTTGYVNTDEACLQLVEVNLPRLHDSKGLRRYMIISVVRADKAEDFYMDLGGAEEFKTPQVRIITGGQEPDGKLFSEHTVGEALEMANHLREGPYQQPEPPKTSNLIQAFHDKPDIRKKMKKKQSSFGYGGILQRS